MTTVGQLLAKAPASPHANLSARTRIGTTRSGSVIWELVCTCGAVVTANAPAIKRGRARCPACNPSIGLRQAQQILAALPGTYARIERLTLLTRAQIEHRIAWMRARDMCFVGGWRRPEFQGLFCPIFHAGKGEDVPCTLKPFSPLHYKRLYARRIKRAVTRAAAGGQENPRYLRHIARAKALRTARQTRIQPQTWWSPLGQ